METKKYCWMLMAFAVLSSHFVEVQCTTELLALGLVPLLAPLLVLAPIAVPMLLPLFILGKKILKYALPFVIRFFPIILLFLGIGALALNFFRPRVIQGFGAGNFVRGVINGIIRGVFGRRF